MKNKSVSQHAFSLVPKLNKPRSVFNRSHAYKTSFDADYLVPIYFKNVLPGDSVNLNHALMVRLLSPTLKPVMDNMHMAWFYFFVPYRLVWSNFQKFMGEQLNPGDSISYTVPQCTGPNVAAGGITVGSLHDYFGLPTGALSGGGGTTGITFNNLWPRAYNRIYQDWFKDENLQNQVTLDVGDGPDTFSNYNLLKRGKRFDYFTSCLPFLQKGSAVSLPLGESADIVGLGIASIGTVPTSKFVRQSGFNGTTYTNAWRSKYDAAAGADADAQLWIQEDPNHAGYPHIYADLSNATAATINTLRQSISLQQFLENDARGGTRYTEIVKQRWGVTSPDARLQRAELLSIGEDTIKLNTVAATAFGGAVDPNGGSYLSAFGTGVSVGNGFSKSFTEHGVIIGMISVRADITYQTGIDRHWSYRTRYDFFNPEFANLGEQAVLNKEIYANVPDGTGASQKDGVFGYQERYAEERYSRSMITGVLRSQAASSLDIWHLSEEFSSLPTLGSTFIQSSASGPIDRAIVVPSEPQFILDAYFEDKWARVMPVFGIPGLLKL